MLFSLDVLPALKGDCLILHYGSSNAPRLIVIDGGPAGVYLPSLKPRIGAIRAKRKLGAEKPLPVDALMISHVDDDHIRGALDMMKELLEAKLKKVPAMVRVRDLWHNSFDDIVGGDPKEVTASVAGQFGAASLSGGLPTDETEQVIEEAPDEMEEHVVVDSLKVLASIEQGFRLRTDAAGLDIPINGKFGQALIVASEAGLHLDLGNDLAITVVGPMQPEIEELRKKHDAWVKAKNEKEEDAVALAAYVDRSVANLSSIVMLAEAGGKRILLTGDARGDRILEGLQLVGLLETDKDTKMHVDVLKVPHHGSANNLDVNFFERITADHYVFSGDGEHGNPERESMEMLFKARGAASFTIHLTYPVDRIDKGREEDWEKERKKEKMRAESAKAKGKKPGKVRGPWSPSKNSLSSFFAENGLAEGQRIVDAAKPHVIDLLEPLGF